MWFRFTKKSFFFCLCDGDADHHHDQNYNHYLRTTAIINTTNITFKNIVNMFTLLYKPILNKAQDFIFQINQISFKIYTTLCTPTIQLLSTHGKLQNK